MDKDEYKFPDEIEDKGKPVEEVDAEDDFQIEVEDDTPPQDRDKIPSDQEFVDELDRTELDEYSVEAKKKLAGFRKVYHDERRRADAAQREQQEAIDLAKRLLEENRALKNKVTSSEQQALDSYMTSADRELEMAKKDYRDAYEAGDGEKLVEAQEKITAAKIKAERALNISEQRALQRQESDVQIQQVRQQPVRDSKAETWRERNSWFGQDDEMTSLALGIHEKLVKEHGMAYATTDEYYKRIDNSMRKRFPENFESIEEDEKPVAKTKPSTVVAPASRSTSSKKVRLTTSQQAIAKKLGLTNEQYARELIKEL